MFEPHSKPILTKVAFYWRLLRYFGYSAAMLSLSLGIGIRGYRHFAQLSWVDAFLNASMILTGMGPTNAMPDDTAKVFSGFYALFSGIAFLSTTAVLFAPVAHRFLHLMHLDEKDV